MHATKDEGVVFDNMGIMVTNQKKIDWGRLFQREQYF